MKQILHTIISPITHLRNLMSSWMFEMKRTKAVKLQKSCRSKGVISNQITLKQLKSISEGVKKRIAKLTKKMREAERQKEEAFTLC